MDTCALHPYERQSCVMACADRSPDGQSYIQGRFQTVCHSVETSSSVLPSPRPSLPPSLRPPSSTTMPVWTYLLPPLPPSLPFAPLVVRSVRGKEAEGGEGRRK